MALSPSRTLLALFVTFCAPGCGWTAEKSPRPQSGKQASVEKGLKESWEPSIHLDGRPVDRFTISSSKPPRSHRFSKVGRDSRSHLLEDVDPEWINLDGFAVLGGGPVNSSSAGPPRSPQTPSRSQPPAQRATRVDRTVHPSGMLSRRTHRRAPQSSSGPRQPERAVAGAPPLERRRIHHTKPQSDQRNRNTQKLTSESVHVVSLQAQRALGQSAPANRAVTAKTMPPEPPEYEAKDISVRVMSPQSVLISWVDPAVELGKVEPGASRSYTVRYREKGESARWEYKDSTQRRMMIDTLSADGMYEFSVRISQGENPGKWSVSVFQRTPESAPSGPPENFEVKPLRGKGTAVIATWDPPEEPNGRIREYILSYAPAMKPFGMKSVTHRGSTTSATVDGLIPGDRYIFKIKATNRRGAGPQSKAFSVVMPGSRSAASSPSKTSDSSRISHTPSRMDTDHEESDIQSTEIKMEPTTPPKQRPAAPASRRVRPLSQTRSYHSIFSSVRGSVRNPINRGSTRGREDEEQEEVATTPSPAEETTTIVVVPETKEPDNNVSPDSEDEFGYDAESQTNETPSLKVYTPSPTKPTSVRPKPGPKRPIKIRVHEKPGSKATSSSSSASSSSSLSASSSISSSPTSSTSSSPSSTSLSSSRIQESAANRKDHVASTYPESKNSYDKLGVTRTQPSTAVERETTSQQKEGTYVGRGSATAGRTNGSGFGSRNGFSRRHPGISVRGNSTRLQNVYKPAITSQSNFPIRTPNQATTNTESSAASQATSPESTQNLKTSPVLNTATSRSSSESGTQSQTTSGTYSRLGSSHSTSHNTQSSSTIPEQETGVSEENNDNSHKNTESEATKVEEPTPSSKPQQTEEQGGDTEGRKEISSEKLVPRTRLSPSFAERFPWLATRYPGRFSQGTRVSSRLDGRAPSTRTSSSIGAGRPTRVSGATGAAGVSTIQETSENLRNPSSHNPLKNGEGVVPVKPSLTTASRDNGGQTTSSSSTAVSSDRDSHHSTGGQRESSSSNRDSHHSTGGQRESSSSNRDSHHATSGQRESSSSNRDSHHATSGQRESSSSNRDSHHSTSGQRESSLSNRDSHHSTGGQRESSSSNRDSHHSTGGQRESSSSNRDSHHTTSGQRESSSSHRDSHHSTSGQRVSVSSNRDSHHSTSGQRESSSSNRDSHHSTGGQRESSSSNRDSHHSTGGQRESSSSHRDSHHSTGGQRESVSSNRDSHQSTGGQRESSSSNRDSHQSTGGQRESSSSNRDSHHSTGGQRESSSSNRDSHHSTGGQRESSSSHRDSHHSTGGQRESVSSNRDSHQSTGGQRESSSSNRDSHHSTGGQMVSVSSNRDSHHSTSRQRESVSSNRDSDHSTSRQWESVASNRDTHHPTSGQRESSESIHQGTLNKENNHGKFSLNEQNRGSSGKHDQTTDNTAAEKSPLTDPHRPVEDNESFGTRETASRMRPSSGSGVTPAHRRPGVGTNGRVRSPLSANRQFGGSRLPIRPQPAQNSRLGSDSSSDSSVSSNVPPPVLTTDRGIGSGTTVTRTGGLTGSNSQSTSSSSLSSRDGLRGQGGRTRYPIMRGKPTNGGVPKPGIGNGKNGRPNLTTTNDKDSSPSHGTSKAAGQKFITGPDGRKWTVDLEQGILMNQDGQVLQDSQGKPKRVVLGEDGRTIFDLMGSPLMTQEGVALFGHGRDSRPVVNPKEKILMVGGKPLLGLDVPQVRTTTTTTTTIAPTTTTTTPEPTTTEWIIESTTEPQYPTCPPGTYSKTDEYGYPIVDPEGILDCYPEEESSGMEMDHMVPVTMVPDALALEKDELIVQTTLPPTTTTTTTATTTTQEPETKPANKGPSSEYDLSGKKRFTAPYVNYIRKDPGAPCSLTEALEFLQVDVLENLIEKDSLAANQNQPPKNKPHNLTVVAMEGCHSFIILDWARPLKDDMVSGYMVYSASYDDVLNNRWSSRTSSGTHLPVENLKPNSRYYFKVQAKNVFGLGPVSDTLTYVTESDDPLLIERPPGGEPIWVPFTFKYNSAHSSCKGSQYVKRTWYRKFVGVVLCNSLRYKIFMGDGLREPFYSIGDTFGQGEDHCQFVDSYRDGRTGPAYLSTTLPTAQGYYRAYRQEPVTFGVIGRRTPHPFVGWYECGVPIPGKW